MSELKIGFSRCDITPDLGCLMSGYFETRVSDGVLLPLLGTAVAATDGADTVIIMSLDLVGIYKYDQDVLRKYVAEAVGLTSDSVMIACTHTHLGPVISREEDGFDLHVFDQLKARLGELAKSAMADMRPAEMYFAEDSAQDVSFVRIFKMQDGTIMTNPGWQNPDVLEQIGEGDDRVGLVVFKREDAPDVALINFQVHADVIGGTKFCADYPHYVRETFEKSVENTLCMYINGANGDLNHIDIRLGKSEMRDGLPRSEYMGRKIAESAANAYTRLRKSVESTVSHIERPFDVSVDKGTDEEVEEAKHVYEIWKTGRENELFTPEELDSMAHNIAKGKAERIVRLIGHPSTFAMNLCAVRIGDFALACFPAEPFSVIGRRMREEAGFPITFSACCCNGYENSYLAMREYYGTNAYEPQASIFACGEAERVSDEMLDILKSLK